MPVERDTQAAPGPLARVEHSVAVELLWLAITCGTRPTERPLPEATARRADEFWGDGEGIDAEVLLVAQQLGCLTGPGISALFALDRAKIAATGDHDLRTESPELRRAIGARMARLSGDAAVRRRYSKLLREIWSSGEGDWTGVGQAVVDRSLRRMRASLEHGLAPLELIPATHIARRDDFVGLTMGAITQGTLLLSPSYFAGERGFTIALPGVLTVAVGAGVSHDMARRRTEAERVARGLKLLSDPTRLLILTELERAPATIGEIARRVAVAQPTASVHVKQLREAGLVVSSPGAGSVLYRAQPERIRQVLDDARAVSIGAEPPHS